MRSWVFPVVRLTHMQRCVIMYLMGRNISLQQLVFLQQIVD